MFSVLKLSQFRKFLSSYILLSVAFADSLEFPLPKESRKITFHFLFAER